jgi:hypothetical protein
MKSHAEDARGYGLHRYEPYKAKLQISQMWRFATSRAWKLLFS